MLATQYMCVFSSTKPSGFSFFRTLFEKVISKNAGRYRGSLVLNLVVETPADDLNYRVMCGKKNLFLIYKYAVMFAIVVLNSFLLLIYRSSFNLKMYSRK